MGIQAAPKPDLISLEEQEKLGCIASPSEKYEAIVRYLVSQKYGTVSALCEATELTRPSVQTRIFKGAELGNKVLTALAKAGGVTLKDLHSLPIRELRTKLDKHLASDIEETREGTEHQEISSANTYLHYMYAHFAWTEALRTLQTSGEDIEESDKLEHLDFYSANLFVGSIDTSSANSEPDAPFEEPRIYAPNAPSGLRVSLCGILAPYQRIFNQKRHDGRPTPPEGRVAFIVLVLGKNEIQRFQDIVNYIFDTRNALNASFGTKAPKFCVLTIHDDFNSSPAEGSSQFAAKLRPILADAVIEVDPERLHADARDYSMDLFLTMLETLK